MKKRVCLIPIHFLPKNLPDTMTLNPLEKLWSLARGCQNHPVNIKCYLIKKKKNQHKTKHGILAPCKKINTAQNILEIQSWSKIQALTVPNAVDGLACKSAGPPGKTDGSVSNTYVTTTWAGPDLPEAKEQGCLWEKINCALFKTRWNCSPWQPRVQQGASASANTQATNQLCNLGKAAGNHSQAVVCH